MKESLERIVAWAKAHPWLAALILGAVVLVAYLVYRYTQRTGSGDMTQGVPTSGSTSGDQTVPPDQVGTGGGGALQPPIINTPPPLQVGGGGGGFSGGGYTPIGDTGFAYPSPDMSGAAAISGAAPAQAPVQTALQNLTAQFNTPSGATTMIQNVKAPQKLFMPTETAGEASRRIGKAPTPAQQAGKGRNFSGTFQGVTYVNGFPVGYGGYNQQGGFTYTIPTLGGGTFTQTISQAMMNYGSRTPATTQAKPGQMAVLHGG